MRKVDVIQTDTTENIVIIDFEQQYGEVFRTLNEQWISRYFQMEPSDYEALNDPQGYILDKGGRILVARYKGEPVGVCALIKMEVGDYDFELAKMAVAPYMQGKNIGWRLAGAAIEAARSMGASALYLESNTLLKPAISLYYKLGFKVVKGKPSPYKRCNIRMELKLTE